MMHRFPVLATKTIGSNNKHDPPAKRYCFRATARVLFRDAPCGIFTAFDSSVDVAKAVEAACAHFVDAEGEPELVCEAADLVMYPECPVELTGDIYFARLLAYDGDDEADGVLEV